MLADDVDPTQYYENRVRHLEAEKAEGRNPYPHKFVTTTSIVGYIMGNRSSSSKLFFYDLHGGGVKVQVVADASKSGMEATEFSRFHASVKHGDIVGISGFPGRSNEGELSIFPGSFTVLSYVFV